MNRYVIYLMGYNLSKDKLLSSVFAGMTAADIAYMINTCFLGANTLPALLTSLVVLKTTTGLVYTYKHFLL